MTFNLSSEQIWSGYSALINFYGHLDDPFNSFPGLQHLILFIGIIWWVLHHRTENRRFWPGYFAFTFLAVCGAMAHTKELTNKQVDFGLWELIFFLLSVFWGWVAWKKKHLFQITDFWPKWWIIIPLVIGLWYPISFWGGKGPGPTYFGNFSLNWKDFFLSPFSLWPQPTLIILLSVIGLTRKLPHLGVTVFTALAGLYFGWLGVFKMRVVWDWALVVVSSYIVFLALCAGIKNSVKEVNSEKN
ncbi:MAG: hypothetical protein ABII74_10375 [Elusimicrobiota bacterium]